MKEEILFMLKEQREAIDKAIDYIELHSVSKVDLLLEMQQMNTKEENVPAVKNLYEKFFREPKEKDETER